MKRPSQSSPTKFKSFSDLLPYLADEEKARELFEAIRWPHGAFCPHCRASRVYRINRPGRWKCGECRKQFSATVNTVFEGSHIPLSKWLHAIFMMCTAKKGVPAKQLQRELGISYKSAWFMCHRVRLAMDQSPLFERLGGKGGIVEIDETYIGGKASNNKHRGYKPKPKAIVATMVDRSGPARTYPVPHVKRRPIEWLVRRSVDPDTNIATDGHAAYKRLEWFFKSHQSVDHDKEFVRGIVHTNFAESYHSLLKRGVFGIFHHVSDKHLPRYLREFEFRWNRRELADFDMLTQAIQGAGGKRLTYQRPISRRGRSRKDGSPARSTTGNPLT